MKRKIRFDQEPDEWKGPLKLLCKLDEGHSSIRYLAGLAKQKFTFYPPLALLIAKTPAGIPTVTYHNREN